MIARTWRGYTTKENSKAYEKLLKESIFKGIEAKNINGYKGVKLLKREVGDEHEFVTILFFESIEHVVQFAGQNYEKAYVLPEARELLKYYDREAAHYELLHEQDY